MIWRTFCVATALAALGCGRTVPGDGRPDGEPPYSGYPRVIAGASKSCLLDATGRLSCWGKILSSDAPPDRAFKSVDIGLRACGLERDGTLSCWPAGGGTSIGDFPPGRYSTVSTYTFNACAVRLDGTLACWGMPDGGLTDPPPGKFQDVAVGGSHVCAIRADGTLACWGANYNGEATPPAGTFVQITSGSSFSCARNIDNVVACWGAEDAFGNLHGRLARSVHAGQGPHACVLELDGTLTCVGVHNEELIRPPPGRFVQVDVGVGHACALRTDQSIACWGRNTYGESTPPAR